MSAALWTSDDIAAATGGRAAGSWTVDGVAIDSRAVKAGELFVALAGPRHDGHDFLAQALETGAAALIHREANGLSGDLPLVVVDDTFTGLERLGRAGRARSEAGIVAVTGSVGKTGTKEALRHVLAEQASTHASVASFNNHWGVPLSLARMPKGSIYAIFELGMNAVGEIDRLSRLVRPHVAVITAIAPAHLGHFDGVAGIAGAKAEIFDGLERGGCAILNADTPQYDLLMARARAADCGRIVSFGTGSECHARLIEMNGDALGTDVAMELGGRRVEYRIGAPGRHWVQNSLAVLAAVEALGADPVAAAKALATFEPPAARGQRHRLRWRNGWITLIDDSYNANPTSMRAAIEVLAQADGRRIAVLGDMLELGEHAPQLHGALAPALDEADTALVFTAGPLMAHLHDRLPRARRGARRDHVDSLWPDLERALLPGDTVLVKGSLGSRMKVIVDAVTAAAARAHDHPAGA